MPSQLYIDILYNIKDNKYEIDTNIKKDEIKNIISNFLRSQIGQKSDTNEFKTKEIYKILINLDLSCDRFTCKYDCGNIRLRDGILLNYLTSNEENEKYVG